MPVNTRAAHRSLDRARGAQLERELELGGRGRGGLAHNEYVNTKNFCVSFVYISAYADDFKDRACANFKQNCYHTIIVPLRAQKKIESICWWLVRELQLS